MKPAISLLKQLTLADLHTFNLPQNTGEVFFSTCRRRVFKKTLMEPIMIQNRSVHTHLVKMQSAASARCHSLFVLFDGYTHPLQSVEKEGNELRLRYGKRGQYSTTLRTRVPLDPAQLEYLRFLDEDGEFFEVVAKLTTPLMNIPAEQVTATAGEYVGQRFGSLTVTAMLGWKKRNRMARCLCDCGETKDVSISLLRCGHTRSCGCIWGGNNVLPLLPGERHSHLTVIGPADRIEGDDRSGRFYLVRCDCGKEVTRRRDQITRYQNTSCGCVINELSGGERFGKLTVLGETRREKRNTEYRVLCDCGTEKWVRALALKSGKTKSCGCLRSSRHQVSSL